MNTAFKAEIESRVAGIPCLIGVESYRRVKPDYGSWESDWDYLGYTESDWQILDRKGRPAAWLERKLTEKEKQRILDEIVAYFE
jgi:phosphoenolpyruvate synthase/pyruvate phosphate dikinase